MAIILEEVLSKDSAVSSVADLARATPFLFESLHQIAETSDDTTYLVAAAKTADALRSIPEIMEAAVGTITQMSLWRRSHHADPSWIDTISTFFSDNADMPALVVGFADFVRKHECQYMHSFYSHDRQGMAKRLSDPSMRVAADALKSQPENAARYAERMMVWLNWDKLPANFAKVAESYAGINGVISAFLDYDYKPHGEGWGADFSLFVECLANPRVVESAKHYSGNKEQLNSFMKLADYVGLRLSAINNIRSSFRLEPRTHEQIQRVVESCKLRDNETDLLASIADSCAVAPQSLVFIADKLFHRIYNSSGKRLDMLDVAANLQEPVVQKALKVHASRPEVLSAIVDHFFDATLDGRNVDFLELYTNHELLETIAALETEGIRRSFAETAGKIPYSKSDPRGGSRGMFTGAYLFTKDAMEFRGDDKQFDLLMQAYRRLADVSAGQALGYISFITLKYDGSKRDIDYTAHPEVLSFVLSDIVRLCGNPNRDSPGIVSAMVEAYTKESVRKALIGFEGSEPNMRAVVGNISSVLQYVDGGQELVDRIAEQTVMLSSDDSALKSYIGALHTCSYELKDKAAVERVIRFVADNKGSPSLRRGMDYFYKRVFDERSTMQPAGFIAMVDAYPVASKQALQVNR